MGQRSERAVRSMPPVKEVKSNLNQIRYNIDIIHQLVPGLGLQFIVDSNESTATGKSLISVPITDLGNNLTKTANLLRTRFHRPYPVGISVTLDIIG
ncbi:hypothetical protein LguiA_022794 [Lonicera macranthoides]